MITSEGLTAILPHSIPHYTATYITNKHYISPACTTSLVQLPTGADWAFFLDLAPPTESFEFLILSFTCVHKLDDEQARTGPNPLFDFMPIYIVLSIYANINRFFLLIFIGRVGS